MQTRIPHVNPVSQQKAEMAVDEAVKVAYRQYATYVRAVPIELVTNSAPIGVGRISEQDRQDILADLGLSELEFALLCGGDSLRMTQAKILETSFSAESSIMQYLHADERHPPSFYVSDQDAFRKDILQAASAWPLLPNTAPDDQKLGFNPA